MFIKNVPRKLKRTWSMEKCANIQNKNRNIRIEGLKYEN